MFNEINYIQYFKIQHIQPIPAQQLFIFFYIYRVNKLKISGDNSNIKTHTMKNIIYILLIAIAFYACGSQGNKTGTETSTTVETIDPANLETIEIAVYGMTCGGCEKTVKTAVGNLPGVQEVTASHTDSVAVVTFDKTKSGFEEMKAAITGKGYKVADFKVVE